MSKSIDNLMETALKNIRNLIDVNTVIGDPIHAGNETTIIPVSKVTFGFGVGGSDFSSLDKKEKEPNFGGGAGGGMNISPVGFLVVSPNNVRMINVDSSNTPLDKLIDYAPEAVEKILSKFAKKEDKDEVIVTVTEE